MTSPGDDFAPLSVIVGTPFDMIWPARRGGEGEVVVVLTRRRRFRWTADLWSWSFTSGRWQPWQQFVAWTLDGARKKAVAEVEASERRRAARSAAFGGSEAEVLRDRR